MTDWQPAEQAELAEQVVFLGSRRQLEDVPLPGDYDPSTEEFIFKVQERCNLACAYCYMYELRDQSHREQPPSMSFNVMERAARRIGEHADEHGLENVKVLFHGGEPLLNYKWDRDYFVRASEILVNAIGKRRLSLHMQTNGMFITDYGVLDMLAKARISMGISLDGDQKTHDTLRIKRNGEGSFEAVERGILTFAEWKRQRESGRTRGRTVGLGLLSVVNLEADPDQVYDTLTREDFGATSFDFLFPLAHHSMLPPGYEPGYDQPDAPTPYADWLIPLYDRWAQVDASRMSMRLFQSIQRLIWGKSARAEYIGNSFARNLVFEANGDMVLSDSYRVVADRAIALLDDEGRPLNVHEHSVDDAARHPKVVNYRLGKQALAPVCKKCSIVNICGGGLQATRWRDDSSLEAGGSFENPSVYSRDLMKLIFHIRESLVTDMKRVLADHSS